MHSLKDMHVFGESAVQAANKSGIA